MADAKIQIQVGSISFSGEGEGRWLSEQFDKALKNIPALVQVAPALPIEGNAPPATPAAGRASGTLASFLKLKNASTQQVRKFLATAVWLHDRERRERLGTGDVTKALSDNHQSRLSNPADCLNKNVGKGFCEKDGKQFFVTDEGRDELK